MSFPFLNREVKCAFRWYREPGLRNRNLKRCLTNNGCEWAIRTPANQLPPFQILAAESGQVGFSTPTSWKVYDLEGNLVVDLASDLGKLRVVEFASPTREYIIYDGDILSSVLPESQYLESVIECEGGASLTRYSETFKPFCLKEEGELVNLDFSEGTEFWEYYQWDGLIVDIENTPGPPSYGPPEEGDKVINTGDDLLWTYTSGSWVSSIPAEGDYFNTSVIGNAWTQYQSGEFVGVGSGPVEINGDEIICWDGQGDVNFQYFPELPDGINFPVVVEITAMFGAPGSPGETASILLGDTVLGTWNNVNANQPQTFQVTLTGAEQIRIVVDGGWRGCLTQISSRILQSLECLYILEYSNCGDIGTQYYQDGWKNRIYFDHGVYLEPPIPEVTNEQEEDGVGAQEDVFTRKEVRYGLQLGGVPWWFLDALTEIPEHDNITLTDPTVGTTQLVNFTVEAPWGTDKCLTQSTLLSFRALDDSTTNAGCCDFFEAPCAVPCAEVSGLQSDSGPVVGRFYLVDGANQIVERLEGGVWGEPFDCESGFASGVNGFTDQYWTGEEWTQLAGISYEYQDFACETLTVTGFGHLRYWLRLQWSLDNETWTNFDPDLTFNYDGLETPLVLEIGSPAGPGTFFIRFEVFGTGNCVVGYSNTCSVYCQSLVEDELGDTAGWDFVSGGTWTDVADFSDLAGIPDPEPGDLARTTDNNTFYFYDGDSWEFASLYVDGSPVPPVVGGLFPARLCVYSWFEEITGTLDPAATADQHQLQIEITGNLKGYAYLDNPANRVTFDGPGYYSLVIEVATPTSEVHIVLDEDTGQGCIVNLSVRPICLPVEGVTLCNEPEHIGFITNDIGGIFLQPVVDSPATHYTVRFPDGTTTIYAPFAPLTFNVVINDAPEGIWCAWPSNAEGDPAGAVNSIDLGAEHMFELDISGLVSTTHIAIGYGGEEVVSIDFTGLTTLDDIQAGNLGLQSVLGTETLPSLIGLELNGNALPSAMVDYVINSLNAALSGGAVYLNGGTNGPRTAASDTNYTALTSNGWTVLTNP